MNYILRAKQVFDEEIKELSLVADTIDSSFDALVELIYSHTGLSNFTTSNPTIHMGKVVLMGVGKTGIIANKIASSLASTGTPAIFIHATEAAHGDLGMINAQDVVIIVSNSGKTSDTLRIIPSLKNIGCVIAAITDNKQSPLAQMCDIVLPVHVSKEVCPLDLAPTTSTTALSLMGDALVVCLMEKRDFTKSNFSNYHPAGTLSHA